jgi:hypothetical protein
VNSLSGFQPASTKASNTPRYRSTAVMANCMARFYR